MTFYQNFDQTGIERIIGNISQRTLKSRHKTVIKKNIFSLLFIGQFEILNYYVLIGSIVIQLK